MPENSVRPLKRSPRDSATAASVPSSVADEAEAIAAPHRNQPRGVEGIDHEDDDRQVQKCQTEHQRGDVERGESILRAGHQPLPSSSRRCSRSYNTSGPTSSTSNTTATAEATGQSLLVKNSSHRVWPIISELEPAS